MQTLQSAPVHGLSKHNCKSIIAFWTFFLLTSTLSLPGGVALTSANAFAEDLTPILTPMSLQQMATSDLTLKDDAEFAQARELLWQKYLQEVQQDSARLSEHQQRVLSYKDKKMRFSLDKIGARPAAGHPLYIALHGGGTAPAWLNDSQWQHMQIYYKDSVASGIYVAPRGVTDTWNLHFVDESYTLYDRLIENMVAYEGVDPQRVYLTGFSAGGDGVYQVTAKMADRFAAANMSAGHHNWVAFENLLNTPFLIQVGENDSAYNRNRVAAENSLKLDQLQQQWEGGYKAYIHDIFIHVGGSHNSWRDNDASGSLHPVIADARGWLERNDHQSKNVDSNAIHWMQQFTRTSLPQKIIWDIKTRMPREKSQAQQLLRNSELQNKLLPADRVFYWLALSQLPNLEGEARPMIRAEISREQNAVSLTLDQQQVTTVQVRLHPHLLDLQRDVEIHIGQERLLYHPTMQLKTMALTLLERGDLSYSFPVVVTLQYQAEQNAWKVVEN